MSWFTIEGLKKELKRIRWPKPKQLGIDAFTVLFFTASFGVFFVLCDLFGSAFIKLVGIGM